MMKKEINGFLKYNFKTRILKKSKNGLICMNPKKRKKKNKNLKKVENLL